MNPNITGAGKQKQYKCLSHCYCGMSMEFSVVLGAVMTGAKTTRRHHCPQIQLMILYWADVSTKPLSTPPFDTIMSGQSSQSQTTEMFSDTIDQFCNSQLNQAPIRLAVLLVQQKECKLGKKEGCNIFGPEWGARDWHRYAWCAHSRAWDRGLWGRHDALGDCPCAPKASAAQRECIWHDLEGIKRWAPRLNEINVKLTVEPSSSGVWPKCLLV